jgi:hypothetical protein
MVSKSFVVVMVDWLILVMMDRGQLESVVVVDLHHV